MIEQKKTLWKKWWVWVLAVAIIAAIVGGEETEETSAPTEQQQQTSTEVEESESEPKKEPAPEDKQEEPKKEEQKIDTSVFVYAKSVDVTDARDITQHIDIVIHMGKEPTPGLATQHVFTQAYDFLQQEDIKGAKTVTIGVMQGDFRIAQITVNLEKFKAGEHLVDSVLQASKIDKMNDDVKEYGEIMDLW